MPPTPTNDLIQLGREPIDGAALVRHVRADSDGAIVTFDGCVRDNSHGRRTLYLDYEAYEGMAEGLMTEIATELTGRYDLCGVAIHHRIGRVEIGETSVVIAVSAPHRADALAACKDAIDELKQRVPLWKKEVYTGGEECHDSAIAPGPTDPLRSSVRVLDGGATTRRASNGQQTGSNQRL